MVPYTDLTGIINLCFQMQNKLELYDTLKLKGETVIKPK